MRDKGVTGATGARSHCRTTGSACEQHMGTLVEPSQTKVHQAAGRKTLPIISMYREQPSSFTVPESQNQENAITDTADTGWQTVWNYFQHSICLINSRPQEV